MKLIHLEDEDLNSKISKGICLVDFYADWCGPCKMLAPILEEIKENVTIIKINVDKREDLGKEYNIMSIPTVIFFKDGKEVDKFIGFREKEEIEQMIKDIK